VGGAAMTRRLLVALSLAAFVLSAGISYGQQSPFRVLAFYSTDVEADHVDFAVQAVKFFTEAGKLDNYTFDTTTHWEDLNPDVLGRYQVVLWLNNSASTKEERVAFEQYMSHGGGWMGFHAAGYNDKDTNWPWYVDFLGGAVFYGNSWPPLPAQLVVDAKDHPITRHLPAEFLSPANEWYSWYPNPRDNKDVKVLLTLSPRNYPLGLKDILTGGDIPVVWTNTRFKMVYMNMGHGDKIFADPGQNKMFEDALLWLGGRR
jgi:uncharacterized protein